MHRHSVEDLAASNGQKQFLDFPTVAVMSQRILEPSIDPSGPTTYIMEFIFKTNIK